MNSRRKKEFEALKRVDNFANTIWPPLSSPPPGYNEQLGVARSALSDVDRLFTEQQSGALPKIVLDRRKLRTILRVKHLLPLRKVARVLARQRPGTPRIVNLPSRNSTEQVLLSSAKAALEDAAPYHGQLVERGLPVDFLDQLGAAITDVETALADSNALRSRRVKATAGIEEALTRGRDAIRCLDAVVRRACMDDHIHGERTVAAWENASRVERVPVLPGKSDSSPSASGSTTPTQPASEGDNNAQQA